MSKTVQVDTPNQEAIANAEKCADLIEKLTDHLEIMNTDFVAGDEFFWLHAQNTQLNAGSGEYAEIYRTYREKWGEYYTAMHDTTSTMLDNVQAKIEEIQTAMADFEAKSHSYSYKTVGDDYICGENETFVG